MCASYHKWNLRNEQDNVYVLMSVLKEKKFFICKHLIQGAGCPSYRDVELNRSPPFIVITKISGRARPNIDQEWTGDSSSTCRVSQFTAAVSNPISFPCLLGDVDNDSSDDNNIGFELLLGQELREHLTWLLAHVDRLQSHALGYTQIYYVEITLLPRIKSYKLNQSRSDISRRITRTWECRDTVFYG